MSRPDGEPDGTGTTPDGTNTRFNVADHVTVPPTGIVGPGVLTHRNDLSDGLTAAERNIRLWMRKNGRL